jgi:hypothetical protein
MAEPTMAEIATLLQNLTTTIDSIKGTVEGLQGSIAGLETKVTGLQQRALPIGSSGSTADSGANHSDRPPRFQKMDFPKFDGKSDPLAFINRCESFFHQQCIAKEEQVWMAAYNLQDAAQLWYI